MLYDCRPVEILHFVQNDNELEISSEISYDSNRLSTINVVLIGIFAV